jgi:type II secretion system protein N
MTVRQISFYLLYFVSAFILFSILLFPGEKAGSKISNKLGKMIPGVTLQMDSATPLLPAGIKFENPKIVLKNTFLLPFDSFKLRLPLFDILKKDRDIIFGGTLLDGIVEGRAEGVSPTHNRFSKLGFTMAGIRIKNFKYETPNGKIDLSFELKGNATWHKDKEGSNPKGTLVLNHLVADMEDSIFNFMEINTIKFSQIDIDFEIDLEGENKQIIISKCVAVGDMMTIRLKGNLGSTEDMLDPSTSPSINLTGFLLPQPSFIPTLAGVSSMATLFKENREQGIPLQITGSLKAPQIKL